jgi:CHAD domain-containing protein
VGLTPGEGSAAGESPPPPLPPAEAVDGLRARLLAIAQPGPVLLADTLAAAGRKVMLRHVDRLLAREIGVRDPSQPDELRKYRVAARRLRAALRLLGSDLTDKRIRGLRDELAATALAAGAARDLDLRIAHLAAWVAEHPEITLADVAPLLGHWRLQRDRAYGGLIRHLRTRRHARWLVVLVSAVEEPGEAGQRPEGIAWTVRSRAASRITAAYEEIRVFASVVRAADDETLHRLRIAAKRLRYSLEFLADVLGPDSAWLVEQLTLLQDALGHLNDGVVAASAVHDFLGDQRSRLSATEETAIAAYLRDQETQLARLRKAVAAPWRLVDGVGFARRLGRATVLP